MNYCLLDGKRKIKQKLGIQGKKKCHGINHNIVAREHLCQLIKMARLSNNFMKVSGLQCLIGDNKNI